MKRAELLGEENCEEALTRFSTKGQRRGRSQGMTDEALHRKRADLNFILEQNWGLIGWELQRAKSQVDIRDAFSLITEHHHPLLDALRHAPTQHATSDALRTLRKELAEVRDQSRNAYLALKCAKQNAEYARSAVNGNEDHIARLDLQRLLDEMETRHTCAMTDSASIRKRHVELDSQLVEQEAYFAQSQLLNFIQSGRREFTPLNLAMAMAGLPYLTARVSCERCSAIKPREESGQTFRMFQAVEAVFVRLPRDADEEVERMRSYLLHSRRKKETHIVELRKHWYFLESAIRTVCQNTKTPKGALPFRIFAEYQRRFGRQSQANILMARDDSH